MYKVEHFLAERIAAKTTDYTGYRSHCYMDFVSLIDD